MVRSRFFTHHALATDVGAVMGAVEVNFLHTSIGAGNGRFQIVAQRSHAQNAAAASDDLSVLLAGTA